MSFYVMNFYNRKCFTELREKCQRRYGLLPGVTYIVGSGSEAHIRFPGSSMSPRHVSAKVVDDKFFITDLDSLKRTFVNCSVVKPRVAIEVKENSVVKLGEELFVLEKKTICAYLSNLKTEDEIMIKAVLNRLGTVVDEPTNLDAITHVVADGTSCSKYILRAIMAKQFLVKPDFIAKVHSCIVRSAPLPFERHFFIPKLRPDCTIDFRADRGGLFFQWTALFDTEFDFNNFADIITLGGGKAAMIHTVPTSTMSIDEKTFFVRPQDCSMSPLMTSVCEEQYFCKRVIVPKEIQEAVFFNDVTEFCNPRFKLRPSKPDHIHLAFLHPIPPTKENRQLLITRYNEIYPLVPPFPAFQWNLLRRMGDVHYHVDCFKRGEWFVDLTVDEGPLFKWLEAKKLPEYNADQLLTRARLSSKQCLHVDDFDDDWQPQVEVRPQKPGCATQKKTFKRKGREDEDFIGVLTDAYEETQLINTCPALTISVFHLGYDVD